MNNERDTDVPKRPKILIVEDEPDVAETYELWLASAYDVSHAASGVEALEQVDETVDVVLLDRMMPKMSGDEVLAEIRDRELRCRVAMVSAVDPDFDVIEMGFDDYVTKPPTREGLVDVIEQLLERAEYSDRLQEYHSLCARRDALREQKTSGELANSDEYATLEDAIERLDAELESDDELLLDDAAFVGALRDIEEDHS